MEEKRAPHGRPLIASWLGPSLALALLLLLAIALATLAAGARHAALDGQRQVGLADLIGGYTAVRVQELRATLERWGRDAALVEALVVGDEEGLARQAEALRRAVPAAVVVQIRSLADASAPAEEDPELSFAGRDLVRRTAQSGQVSVLEVHRVGSAERHLAIAAPITDPLADGVFGVVYLGLSLGWLPEVGAAGDDLGLIRYQQQVGADRVTIDPAAAAPRGEPDYTASVPDSRLLVAAWSGEGRWLAVGFLAQLAGLSLALLALAGLVVALAARRQQRSLVADLAGILALVEDAAEGRGLRGAWCRLAEPEGLRAQIRPLLERLVGAGRAEAGGVGPAPTESVQAGDEDWPSSEEIEGLAPELKAVLEKRPAASPPAPDGLAGIEVPAEIFRANDIRGLVGETFTEELARTIGRAIGSEVRARGGRQVCVGRDTRVSSEALAEATIEGLRAAGCDVTVLGLVPTPLVYFATRFQGESAGVMVTAGHNPPKYNGVKIVIDGEPLVDGQIAALRERILEGDFASGEGALVERDLVDRYCEHVERDITPARVLKVVLDCGSATTSVVAPVLYRRLGCRVVDLGCDPTAGGRAIDPAQPDCLLGLAERVVAEGADLGLAFDTDGDRLGVVDSGGRFIAADALLLLLAIDVLSRHPGTDVVYDVACSRALAGEVLRHGGRPVMWRSGHARLKAKLRQCGALIAGDADGHIIFDDRWFGFDDALYAGARLIELLAQDPRPSAEVFAALPVGRATPKLYVPLASGDAAKVMAAIQGVAGQVLVGAEIRTIDGLRAEFERGWGLVRAADTRPGLALRFEADDEEALGAVQGQFRRLLEQAAPGLRLPF
jgi:phosphomannomutase/phosphoglucomutase